MPRAPKITFCIALLAAAAVAMSWETGSISAMANEPSGDSGVQLVPTGAARPGLVPSARLAGPSRTISPNIQEQVSLHEIPLDTQNALWDLTVKDDALDINSFEWLPEAQTLLIYSAEAPEVVRSTFSAAMPNQKFEQIHAIRSKKEIDAEIARLLAHGGLLPDGSRIVVAKAAQDGASITLSVEKANGVARMDPGAVKNMLASKIPLVIEDAQPIEPATRNIGYYINFFSGAYMQSAEANRSCSTGFRITHIDSGTPAMLSAEHCGRDHIGSPWHYSTTSTSESLISTFSGMLSNSTYGTDTGAWVGGNTSKMYPGIFIGDHVTGDPLTEIRGGAVPVVNGYVMYSGSRSGNIYANIVTVTGAGTCYSATMCYFNQTFTEQIDGIPAAGNGDSGGPVWTGSAENILAAGIISGISLGSSTCSGDPSTSTRSCSPDVIFSPLNNALGETGWGLNYVP